ncbi:MAG: TolC family protein [Pseudomonadota bacterium]
MPKNYGKDDVDELLAERKVPEQDIARQEMDAYLVNVLEKRPLTIEDATKLALYRNPQIQKSYAQLGFSAADLYTAGRIRNPYITFKKLTSLDSDFRDLTNLSFGFSLGDIIKLPSNMKTAKRNFLAAKQNAAAEILQSIRDVQITYYEYVAAKQAAKANNEFYDALSTSAEFDQVDFDYGLISQRELLELNVVIAEAKYNAIQADNDELAARASFANMLSLQIEDNWTIPDDLTIPVELNFDYEKLTQTAKQASLVLESQKTKIKELEEEVDLAKWRPYVGDLEVGLERAKTPVGATVTGPTLDVQIPLFNHHDDELAILSTWSYQAGLPRVVLV